jgi:DNA primase
LNSWDSLFSFFQEKNISPQLLEKAGVVIRREKKEGYYDRFRGRIIFPIFTLTGKVVAFGGRTIIDAEPKYLNSPDTPIYTKGKLLYGLNFCKNSIREKGELILVEGYTDFLSLYRAGITNIAASLGTSLTHDQVFLARRFALRLIVCYDSDSPGIKAALRAVSLCFERGVQIKIMTLPKGSDPDSFINKSGPDEFKKLVKKSTSGLKYLIDNQLQGARTDIPEEKARIARSIWDEIKKIPDSIVLNEYIKKTSEYLSIDEEMLRSMIQRKSTAEKGAEKDSFLNAEKRLLQIIIEDDAIAQYVFPEIKEEYIWGLKSRPIFMALLEYFKAGKKLSLHEIKEKIEPSLLGSLSKVLLETEQTPSVEEAFECLNTLKQLSLENHSKELKAEITKLEKQGKGEGILSLIKQLRDIKTQLSSLSERNYQNMDYNNRNISTKGRS